MVVSDPSTRVASSPGALKLGTLFGTSCFVSVCLTTAWMALLQYTFETEGFREVKSLKKVKDKL